MDPLIRRFDGVPDADLMVCRSHGVSYQRDMSKIISYDDSYFDKYQALEGQPIAEKINAGRIALVDRYAGAVCPVVDVGIGSGEFIKRRPGPTFGRDINRKAEQWLKVIDRWADDLSAFKAFTFWDVLEHVDNPDRHYFRFIQDGSLVFTCLPVFEELREVRKSRHYKPNEHLYYWTEQGLIDWMVLYRFRLLERQNFETEAGRESITSFAFIRDLPDYHKTLEQYQKLHAPAYGTSAYLHFEQIAREVLSFNPKSILDFGCGRSDLVAHFWNDGNRRIEKYDPAIPQFKRLPGGRFDLVLCTDVMEHIPMASVDDVFEQIKDKSQSAIFTISTIPARAKLPDGRNAHVTLLTPDEWMRWIKSIFRKAVRIPTQWDHIVMVKTF